jgi:hypothetical protein
MSYKESMPAWLFFKMIKPFMQEATRQSIMSQWLNSNYKTEYEGEEKCNACKRTSRRTLLQAIERVMGGSPLRLITWIEAW